MASPGEAVIIFFVSSPPANPAAAPARGPRAWWLGLAPRRRRLIRALLALGTIVVLLVSVVLARFLSVENDERDADLALIEAEARGDLHGMLARLSGCATRPACVATVRQNASNPRLRRLGAVKILSLKSSTAYSLAGASGKTRLAWTVIGQLPVVQCIQVHRGGNFLTGLTITLQSLSAPIAGEADC